MVITDGREEAGVVCICRICHKEFEVKIYDKDKRKLCDSEQCKREDSRNKMREYRKTEKGKDATKRVNLRYRRLEVERVCNGCGCKFIGKKSRKFCDRCRHG